jgi:UDP-glucose:(heptosyl)LPS alpha-1,3-glucosyltransferase
MAVFVGGDWRRKGVDVAIEALALAPAWHLVVVGRGDPRPFQAIARTRDVGDRLHFAGARGDPAPFYAGADAFVLPSAYEAFPLVLLEAAAAGLPLVVTPVNGARELVEDGRNGWLIRRSPEAVAERLNQLGRLGAPERDAMRHAARASTEGLSWSGIGDRYVQLLQQVEVETP